MSKPNRISRLFLNTPVADSVMSALVSGPVTAPAFSLTKVMALLVPLITALVGVLTAAVGDTDFSSGEVAALLISLVGFLAVTGSADVLARAYATAATGGEGAVVPLERPTTGTIAGNPRRAVRVLAVRATSPPAYLCVAPDGTMVWETKPVTLDAADE